MHDILLFPANINNNYDFDCSQHILINNDHGYYTRSTASCRFQVPKLRLSKSNHNFWDRCARVASHLSHSIDLFCITGLKRKLSDIYRKYFYLHNNFEDSCNWRKLCICNNCLMCRRPKSFHASTEGFALPFGVLQKFLCLVSEGQVHLQHRRSIIDLRTITTRDNLENLENVFNTNRIMSSEKDTQETSIHSVRIPHTLIRNALRA